MPSLVVLQDFANIFKAFIGTNYLTISFALKESGLLLGLIGIVFIVFATAHCCYLIIKCKKEVVRRILANPNSLSGYVSSRLSSISASELERTITYGEVARAVLGKLGSILTNVGLFVTQFGFCVSYFIFIADTMETSINSFVHHTNTTNTTQRTTAIPKVHEHETWWQYFTMNLGHNESQEKDVVDYHLLLLIPFPFFIMFAMMRRIRDMGPLSTFANLAVLLGFTSITIVILTDFKIAHDINWYANIKSFPIFFGQVTSAYEGIGTIIPIETSMDGNRGLYPLLLHLALLLFTFIYCFMGVLGYLKYGNEIQQVLIWSLPKDTVISLITNATICIGVLFTYPLQNFVAVEIVETVIWGSAALHENDEALPEDTRESREPLLSSGRVDASVQNGDVMTRQPRQKVRFWKRSVVRTILVVVQFGLAYVLKNSYAYFSALVGAVGSTMLAYIIPCLIHLKLKGRTLHPLVFIKDVFLIMFGLVGMVTGLYCSVLNIISSYSN